MKSTWHVRGLKERCTHIKASLLKRSIATSEEIAAYWPGGETNNTDPSPLGRWIFCYANLVRFMGRTDRGGNAEANRALADALAAKAIPVQLRSGHSVSVYPKSYHALRWLDALDLSLKGALQLVVLEGTGNDFDKPAALAPLLE